MAQRERQRGRQDAELVEQRRRIVEQQQRHRGSGGEERPIPAQPQRANPDHGGSQAGRQQHSRYREEEDRNR
jgi:hypothetical protein